MVKYGETSVIITAFTELFGLQSYIVSGVRTSSKKGGTKASLFQPAAILDLVVYHNELKPLNRVREYRWSYLYRHIFSDVRKNAVAVFMVELMQKCLKQPEANSDLYHFFEDAFIHLDESEGTVMANFALFFSLQLTQFFGLKPQIAPKTAAEVSGLVFDLKEGEFTHVKPDHPHFIEGKPAEVTNELLKVMQPAELESIKLNQDFRRRLLYAYEMYYALHIPDFGPMKTLPVLSEVLS